MIPDRAIRAALVNLHQSACGCHEFCLEGGGGRRREICACYCHLDEPLSTRQRMAAARRLAPNHDRGRRAAVQSLLLHGVSVDQAEMREVLAEVRA